MVQNGEAIALAVSDHAASNNYYYPRCWVSCDLAQESVSERFIRDNGVVGVKSLIYWRCVNDFALFCLFALQDNFAIYPIVPLRTDCGVGQGYRIGEKQQCEE